MPRSRSGAGGTTGNVAVAAEVFVDAGVWYGAVHRGLAEHGLSLAVLKQVADEGLGLVTTNLVVAEVHASLLRRVHRRAALGFLRGIYGSRQMVVWSTPDLEVQAVHDWVARYDDHDFSLADAVSFTVMAERGIEEALTFDRQFAAAGFRVRPRPPRGRRR